MAVEIKTVVADSFSMDYFCFGKGDQPLVILPGLSIQSVMGAADAIAQAYRSLEDIFTIYVFDRRSDLPENCSIKDMAEDTVRAIEAVGLKSIYLFGASQGGMIAQLIAVGYPGLVRKLIIGSSASEVDDGQFSVIGEWIKKAKEKDKAGLFLDFGEKIYAKDFFESNRDALIMLAETVTDEELRNFIISAEGIEGFNITSELHKIMCPVLAIGVYGDKVLGENAALKIADAFSGRDNFTLFMYHDYGHAAFDTAPDYRKRLYDFFME